MPPREMNINRKGCAIFAFLFFTPLFYGLIADQTFEEQVSSMNSWKYERIAFSLCLALLCLIWLFPPVAEYFAKNQEKQKMTIDAAKYSSAILFVLIILTTFFAG